MAARDSNLKAFAAALAKARSVRHLAQKELADAVGSSQPTVSAWEKGFTEPPAAAVFALERVLKLNPGSLSRHLGYVPVEGEPPAPTFEAAVVGDELLDERTKRGFLAFYTEMTAGVGRKRGPKPKG
jgi:transcriptional regulator with XRE-family HTH domain